MKYWIIIISIVYSLSTYSQYENSTWFDTKIFFKNHPKCNKVESPISNRHKCFIPRYLSLEGNYMRCRLEKFEYRYNTYNGSAPEVEFLIPKNYKFDYSKCHENYIVLLFVKNNKYIIVSSYISKRERLKDNAATEIDSRLINIRQERLTLKYSNCHDYTKEPEYREICSWHSTIPSGPFSGLIIKDRMYGLFRRDTVKMIFMNMKENDRDDCIKCCESITVK